VTVIAALEFKNEIAAGGGAREADGAHGGLSAGTYQAYFLDRGQRGDDARGEFRFGAGGHAVACAARGLLGDCANNIWIRVPQNQGAQEQT